MIDRVCLVAGLGIVFEGYDQGVMVSLLANTGKHDLIQ